MRPTARTDGSDSSDPSNVRWNASVAAASGYFALRDTHACGHDTAGLESERHVLQPHQALQQQRRQDDQHRGETGLRDDEARRHASRPNRGRPLPLCVSAGNRLTRAARLAGTMPKNTPHAIVMNSPKPRMVASRPISSVRGIVAGTRVRNACIEKMATVTPQAPLTIASETLSVSSCRARRAGRAPSAVRNANSR